MAAQAGHILPGFSRIRLVHSRMPIAEAIPAQDMFSRVLALMASGAEVLFSGDQQHGLIRGMGKVAARALPSCDRLMDILMAEGSAIVTSIAKIGKVGFQELYSLSGVRGVASGTAHAKSAVSYFPCDDCALMAAETEVWQSRRKPFAVLIRDPMRDIAGVDAGVADRTAHSQRGMDGFSLGQFSMALQAVDLFSGSRKCHEKEKQQARQGELCFHSVLL